jgi:hypothetical protein
LTIGLKYALGAELDADPTTFAPGAEYRDVTAWLSLFAPRNLNGGWIRRLFCSHINNLHTTGGCTIAPKKLRSILPPVTAVSRSVWS